MRTIQTLAMSLVTAALLIVLTSCSGSPGGSGSGSGNGNGNGNGSGSGSFTIGGTVSGLKGSGLVLQDNGGDNLAVSANGAFTFATPIASGVAYKVTVLTQPTSPAQTCSVGNAAGTATSNVASVKVTCAIGTLSVGGTVSGLSGTGLVLQNSDGDTLPITASGNFTFATLLVTGSTYDVTVQTQPSSPAQTCTITNGRGTIHANVTNIQVVCPAAFFTIGGNVVGLQGTNAQMVLQDNGGDNLTVTGNGPFTFNTPLAFNSAFDVEIFVAPTTQPMGCVVWGFQGTATANVTSILVDCGHNDWTFMDGSTTANSFGSGSTTPPTVPSTSQLTYSPGGRRYPATWTDNSGNLWLFGGYGYTYTMSSGSLAAYLNDMWVYQGSGTEGFDIGSPYYFGGDDNFWEVMPQTGSVPPGTWGAVTWTDSTGNLWMFGGQDANTDFLSLLSEFNPNTQTWTNISGGFNTSGVYGTEGTPAAGNHPGARWGASARINNSNTMVYVFGGQGYDSAGTLGLLNDLWTYNLSTGQWTWIAGSKLANQSGTYGTKGTGSGSTTPGGRQESTAWVDSTGNFWIFGGYDLDAHGNPDALNDLWEFTGSDWIWQAGSNTVDAKGVYGTSADSPGARWAAAGWTDLSGNLWMFGGEGFDATANGPLSDLWEWKGGKWTWVKGPSSVNQAGVYGIAPNPTVWPHVTNNPGGRWEAGYWVVDVNPNGFPAYRELYMFGGEGFDSSNGPGNGLLSDLWRYLPYP